MPPRSAPPARSSTKPGNPFRPSFRSQDFRQRQEQDRRRGQGSERGPQRRRCLHDPLRQREAQRSLAIRFGRALDRKIAASDKSKIEDAVKEVKEALKGGDASTIRSASEKLNEAWQSVSAELYKAAAEKARASKAQSQPGPKAGAEPKSEDKKGKDEGPIIDAEVVDDKK